MFFSPTAGLRRRSSDSLSPRPGVVCRKRRWRIGTESDSYSSMQSAIERSGGTPSAQTGTSTDQPCPGASVRNVRPRRRTFIDDEAEHCKGSFSEKKGGGREGGGAAGEKEI